MSSMNSVNDRLEAADADGSYDGYVIGYVTTNVDPDGTGRVKVKIPNVFDTDQGEVPWCLPTRKSPFGQGPGYGVYGSPKIGSPVRVSFQNGDPHYPVYEADEYLKAHANPKFKSPDTWGYKDPAGNELFVNMKTGAWEFTHQSKLTLKYDGLGNLTQYVPSNTSMTTKGDTLIASGGQILLQAPASIASGNFTVGTGWTGSFGTPTGQTVTVQNGIIINVV